MNKFVPPSLKDFEDRILNPAMLKNAAEFSAKFDRAILAPSNKDVGPPVKSEHAPTLRVLRDRVIVRRFEYQHPLLAVVGVVLQKGEVVAVGYGRRQRRKTAFTGMPGRTIFFEDGEETGKILPMKVSVGDVVEFSPREQVEFTFNGEQLIAINQNSIYGVDPSGSKHKALLFQQSAGFDREGNFLSGKESWDR